MQIGIIRKNARGVFVGAISTLDLGLINIGLKPVGSTNPEAPAFEVVGWRTGASMLNAVKLGALWEKTYSDGSGTVFLQGQLNDPSFPKAMRIACFTIGSGDEVGNLSVVWDDGTRRNRQTTETKEEATTGDGLGPTTANDSFGFGGNDQHQDDYDYQP